MLLQVSQPIPAGILMICAWSLLIASVWRFWRTCQAGVEQLKRLHRVPCHRCVYFTGNYHLKCTVHPHTALTETAIDCRDFEPSLHPVPSCSKSCKQVYPPS
ncbi:hypothetical protein [Egbenema bharatensis]|uniref:hypothetical protein n=1 Tax=Egbenema bharatensis TaxID=3463334 RepID=UPI003A891C46